MNPSEILANNHDLHLHSRQFSDSWHSIQEVIRYGLRWQKPPHWVGLSDHSPFLEEIVPEEQIDLLRRSSPARFSGLYQKVDDLIRGYILDVRSIEESFLTKNIRVLLGLELEWCQEGPIATQAALQALDYVITAYHGRRFTSARQAERFLCLAARHPYSDIFAHPDRFLGEFNPHTCNWRKIFDQFASHHVLCEYNLTTPLSPEVFNIARDESEVRFVIGSDIHDFRDRSTQRIRDAWSESLGGGFEFARDYLSALLRMACSAARVAELATLYDSHNKLETLELKIYTRTRRNQPHDVPLSAVENDLIRILDEIQDSSLDQDFLIQRLRRFSKLPSERIASLLPIERFQELILQGRKRRQTLLQSSEDGQGMGNFPLHI